MRHLISILLIAAIAPLCFGSMSQYKRASRAQTQAGVTYTPLISENCEGAGTPSGWTNQNTVNWDAGTAAAGSQCLLLVGGPANRSAYVLSQGYSSLTVFMAIRMTSTIFSGGINNSLFELEDLNGTKVASFAFGSATGSFLVNNGTTSVTEVGGYSGNTYYYVWLQYIKGSGANGITRAYISTTTTKPSTPTVQITAGNATADARILRLQSNNGCCDIRFDYIRLADYVMESSPP